MPDAGAEVLDEIMSEMTDRPPPLLRIVHRKLTPATPARARKITLRLRIGLRLICWRGTVCGADTA
jgi:hypothetical protein